jgi:hypothetical protein
MKGFLSTSPETGRLWVAPGRLPTKGIHILNDLPPPAWRIEHSPLIFRLLIRQVAKNSTRIKGMRQQVGD